MSETSLQAQFLIPMAISLAFGVLFATLVSLLLVPAVYLLIQDMAIALSTLVSKTSLFKTQEFDDRSSSRDSNSNKDIPDNRAADSAA